jgi:hypothetical protein
MASSNEAFDKLRKWKNSRTSLRLTVVTNGGQPFISTGEIAATDENEMLFAFADPRTRDVRQISLVAASFEIGERLLKAERAEDNFLVLEEFGLPSEEKQRVN